MYFFKSVLDIAEVELQDGQILVKNLTGRPFRVGTPGQLVRPDGLAVVQSNDPIVRHNLNLNRIAEIGHVVAKKSSSAPKKARKKKSESSDGAGQPEVVAVEEAKVDEVEAETPAVEATPVEAADVPVETGVDVEQPKLAPNVDEGSL